MDLFKKEPAVILGLVVGAMSAITTAAAQATTTGDIDWWCFTALVIPALTGLATRFAVFSPATVEKVVTEVQEKALYVNGVAGSVAAAVTPPTDDDPYPPEFA